MYYFVLLISLFFSNWSYAIIPSQNTTTTLLIAKEETKVKKEENSYKKVEKKKIKKQIQQLKYKLFSDSLKTKKQSKELNGEDYKDKKLAHRSSRRSASFGLIGYGTVVITTLVSKTFFLAALLASPFGLLALIYGIKSIIFLVKNPKSKNNTYKRGRSILLTVIGMYLGIALLAILVVSFITLFGFIQ